MYWIDSEGRIGMGNPPTSPTGAQGAHVDSPVGYLMQRAIDFTPAARELGQAVRKRESRAARMLARLKCGPATTLELMTLGGAGFSSRLHELREAGHRITCEQHVHEGSEWAIYRIEEGA
jgi:hypothetical protein